MTTMRNKYDAIVRGRKALLTRMTAELKNKDDESSTEQFLDAETTVDQYLDAVMHRTTAIPVSEDLAFACAILLITAQAIEQRDMGLLGQLCAPEIAVDLVAIAPQIEEMKMRAIIRLAKLANEQEQLSDWPEIDDVPF